MKLGVLFKWPCFHLCCCQHWLRFLLLTSILVNVSPENATAHATSDQITLWNTICPHNGHTPTEAPTLIDKISTHSEQQIDTNDARREESSLPHKMPQEKEKVSITGTQSNATTSLGLVRSRQTRQADQPIDKCRLFVEGDSAKNELYSPDYPNNYPKNINCTRVITAPKGQIIRLDFRNSFEIEVKDDCKYDFLEIRDGQYGFSNLIGKFCGTDFPPEITSKERYLWLHFHSDDSIEYSGFTAVYEFIDRNREAPSTDLNCTIESNGFEGFINTTQVPQEIRDVVVRNKIPLDCMWRIQVQDKWKIQVKFLDFHLSKPNDCDANFLDIFPEQTVIPRRVRNFCGSAGEGITSDTNVLHIRLYAEQIAINSTFAILYTAFRDRGTGCTEDEYDCEDATCISIDLRCNKRNNCKFSWDEDKCPSDKEPQSEHMTIIMTVFGLILGGMVISFLVNCVRKIVRDQKIIRNVPVLNAGIYHIDSFVMGAPKTAIFVGLNNDYMLKRDRQNERNGDNAPKCQYEFDNMNGCRYAYDRENCNYDEDDEFVIVTNWINDSDKHCSPYIDCMLNKEHDEEMTPQSAYSQSTAATSSMESSTSNESNSQ